MACLYTRERSPFYWIKFKDPFDGKVKYESTGLRVGSGPNKRAALELEAEKTLAERATGKSHASEKWTIWAKEYIETHYAQNPSSQERFLTAWRSLERFLREMKISTPRQLTREHCTHYFKWRKKHDVKDGKYRAGHNTALLEIKTLSLLMKESVRRGFAKDNPARDLGIKRAPRKLYAELTDEVIETILNAIPNEPEPRRTFLLNSFLIARYHGVRLNETFLNPQTEVWEQEINGAKRWMILFHQKGGKQRPKILHPALIPLLSKLKSEGAVQTYERPDKELTRTARASRTWFEFLKRCGVKKQFPTACFHSLRVTAATRLARAGVSERKAMEYLTHASTTIHQAYIRWRPEDMDECHGAL